jgi:Flp pilus assembly protein TadG
VLAGVRRPVLARVRLPVLARLLRDPGGDRGALTLSYVVVLPVVFLFLMVIVQASFWFLAKDAALAAARQGADAARSLGSTTTAGPAAALAFARRASGYLLDPSASATASRTTVTVTVTGTVPSFVPGLPIGISETAQAPIEQFQQ